MCIREDRKYIVWVNDSKTIHGGKRDWYIVHPVTMKVLSSILAIPATLSNALLVKLDIIKPYEG